MSDRKPAQSTVAQKLNEELRTKGEVQPLTEMQIDAALAGIDVSDKADAVFEGGGVKGIALAGAVQVAERKGVQWQCLGGTSAGAITACLLAAGYSADELVTVLTKEMDFEAFMDEGMVDKIPLLGKMFSALFEKGIYEGDYFEQWMQKKLEQKGKITFADFKKSDGDYRLKLIASDVTRRKMLILPDDLPEGLRDTFSVAHAVRMSMSIPYFFEPVVQRFPDADGVMRKSFIVDGGMLSNYPVWLFDAPSVHQARWPTFGFKLVEPTSGEPSPSNWPHEYALSLITTMMEAHDKAFIDVTNFKRTIGIPTMGIQTTQFDISDAGKNLLIRAGQEAAIAFFKAGNHG